MVINRVEKVGVIKLLSLLHRDDKLMSSVLSVSTSLYVLLPFSGSVTESFL